MKTRIKFVESWKDRHGKMRFYFRKGKGARFPLRGPEGSPEFWEDYHAAANGEVAAKPSYKRADPDSIRWLVEQYYKCSAFLEISEDYKKPGAEF